MLTTRTTAKVVGVALLGLTPLSAVTATQAADHDSRAAVTHVSAKAELQAKPTREITEKIVDKGRLYFRGHVGGKGGYKNKPVIIERANKHGGPWTKVKTVRTDGRSNYNTPVAAPRNGKWFYRAKVLKTNNFATSFSPGDWYAYTI